MSGTTPEKDSSPKQKPDETQAKTTRVQATHTPKSKDESPDQNQQSQCRLSRPQQSESKRKRKRKRTHTSQSSEEPRITSPDAVVYEPNQSDEELLEKATAKSQKHMGEEKRYDWMEKKSWPHFSALVLPITKSEWMEKKFTYPPEYSQSQNQQNNTQTGPESDGANGLGGYGLGEESFMSGRVFEQKSEWMEEKFTYPQEYSQPQNEQNNIQTPPPNANGPSQPGGSNPVQGNPPSRMRSRVSRLFCLRN